MSNSSIPKGAIIIFASDNTNIAGWALCDGNNGTPDLRGMFISGESWLMRRCLLRMTFLLIIPQVPATIKLIEESFTHQE